MRHRTALAMAATATLTFALSAYASPVSAQETEGLAEFETEGSTLEIAGPSELETVPSLIPDRSDFAFLGEPGDLVWVAGTIDGATFPTLDATGVADDLTVDLHKRDGPGDAWLYTFTGPGQAQPLASTAEGRPFELAGGTSTVVVLAVDEPGRYTLELRAKENGDAKGYTAASAYAQTGSVTAETTYNVTAEAATAEPATALAAPQVTSQVSAQNATTCEVIGVGHVDIGPRFVDGEWTAQLRDDRESASVWRDLSDVVLQVPDAALFPIPEGDFGFLGQTGDEIYMLPQTQVADLVWPGWNTQDTSVVEGVPGSVDWNLVGVEGPGEFTLFLTGTFGGAEVLFDSGEALPQTVAIPRNTHAHGNWTFTAAGGYRLTVEFAATTADGETVSDDKVIQLAVGDQTDPADACNASGGGGSGNDADSDEGGLAGLLPTTGTGWVLWGLAVGAIAVGAGAVLMILTRRRRTPRADGAVDAG